MNSYAINDPFVEKRSENEEEAEVLTNCEMQWSIIFYGGKH